MAEEGQQLAKQETPPSGFQAMIQQAPQPQGQAPAIVALDRETLAFYGSMITGAGLVPSENGVSPEMSRNRVMAKCIAGASYGFDPVLSQQCFDVLFNRMTPNAHGMEILFRDSGEYDTRIERLDDQECVVIVLQRVGGEWNEEHGKYSGGTWNAIGKVKFTYEMAKAAGLPNKNKIWEGGFRQDMLYSKVMKRVVKRYNPLCLRPRLLLGNHFAKAHQPPAQIAPPAAQIPASVDELAKVSTADPTVQAEAQDTAPAPAGSGTPYQDQPYSGAGMLFDPEDDAIEAEIVDLTATADEPTRYEGSPGQLEDLRGKAIDLLMTKFSDHTAGDDFLDGRVIDRLELPELKKLVAELEALPDES